MSEGFDCGRGGEVCGAWIDAGVHTLEEIATMITERSPTHSARAEGGKILLIPFVRLTSITATVGVGVVDDA